MYNLMRLGSDDDADDFVTGLSRSRGVYYGPRRRGSPTRYPTPRVRTPEPRARHTSFPGDPVQPTGAKATIGERGARRGALPGKRTSIPGNEGDPPGRVGLTSFLGSLDSRGTLLVVLYWGPAFQFQFVR